MIFKKKQAWLNKSIEQIANIQRNFLYSNLLQRYLEGLIKWSPYNALTYKSMLKILNKPQYISFIKQPRWETEKFNIYGGRTLSINEQMVNDVVKQYVKAHVVLLEAAYSFNNSNDRRKLQRSLVILRKLKHLEVFNTQHNKLLDVLETDILTSPELEQAIKVCEGLKEFLEDAPKRKEIFKMFVSYAEEQNVLLNYGVFDYFCDVEILRSINESMEYGIHDLSENELKELSIIHKMLTTKDLSVVKDKLMKHIDDEAVVEEEILLMKQSSFRHFVANYLMIAKFELARRQEKAKYGSME